MKIAVTCENGQVFQHFGHTTEFAIFNLEDGKIISETRLAAGEVGHGALAGLLANDHVDVLICGGIGGGAMTALDNAGIKVIGGAEGDVRTIAEAFAAGSLQTRKDFHCQHHQNQHQHQHRHHHGGHGEGHACGNHGCGGGGCAH